MLYIYVKTMGWTSRAMGPIRWAGEGLGRTDDVVQALIRDKILHVGSQVGDTGGYREVLAMPFMARPNSPSIDSSLRTPRIFPDNAEGWSSLAASRALQLGGLTGAGYAIAQLSNQFGSPADEPTSQQLLM